MEKFEPPPPGFARVDEGGNEAVLYALDLSSNGI